MKQPLQKMPPEQQVEHISREFEEFVYVVSHDLGAPLRHIKEFTRLIVQTRGVDTLNQEEMEYVHFLEVSLKKMEQIQQALLDYSRITTRVGLSEKVSCGPLITECMHILKKSINVNDIDLQIADLPDIYVNRAQAQTVFLNILSNAIKFQAPGSTPKITINASNNYSDVYFEISDNGIGIDRAHLQEVFKLFRKLHTPEVFPGIGAGLTIAKKIIERHGGEVFLTSELGQGTTVFFSFPGSV